MGPEPHSPSSPTLPYAYHYLGEQPAVLRHALDTWLYKNNSLGILILTFVIILAVGWGLGRNTAYELLFFTKRVVFYLKDMAYRMSTGLVKPSMIAHAGTNQTNVSTVGSILARTGLTGLATRMAEKKPIGLGNFDFSCYQNSIIQGLASLVSLPAFLDSTIDENDASKAPTSDILKATIKALNTLQDRRMMMLPRLLKSMSSIEQQDAQEYYSKVLDQLDKEWKATGTKSPTNIQSPVANSPEETVAERIQNPLEGLIAQRVGCLKCGHSDGISLIPFNDLTLPLDPYSTCHVSECLDEYTKLEIIEGVECAKCTLLESESKLLKMKSMPLPEKVLVDVNRRLAAIRDALREGDFTDRTLAQKCELPKKLWKSTTKSKQQVIGRPPTCFVAHVNRSVFNETTGDLYKNQSNVAFPPTLDLGPWCVDNIDFEKEAGLGSATGHKRLPSSVSDPRYSMLPPNSRYPSQRQQPSDWQYELRAVVVHYGRHENGHYICYRKYPTIPSTTGSLSDSPEFGGWWELSDDDVQRVTEEEVLGEGQVFMLFYELVSASLGELEASLRIAVRVPLPAAELDEDLQKTNEFTSGVDESTNQVNGSSLTSSEEELPTEQRDHSAMPSASLPRMLTGINTASGRYRTLDQAGRIVDVA